MKMCLQLHKMYPELIFTSISNFNKNNISSDYTAAECNNKLGRYSKIIMATHKTAGANLKYIHVK